MPVSDNYTRLFKVSQDRANPALIINTLQKVRYIRKLRTFYITHYQSTNYTNTHL